MKITLKNLKQIIQEEIEESYQEESSEEQVDECGESDMMPQKHHEMDDYDGDHALFEGFIAEAKKMKPVASKKEGNKKLSQADKKLLNRINSALSAKKSKK